ncbi:hypothetical protein GGC65_002160 [Sphingopyxis sp. OAS728]|uniref:hypothetical protein n=1 Tax=Sphingopyxis sp. OAS728 TaxID=2663823 RepID=UPI00178A6E6C|nr:hypothetical protein [Sphingopyxis sp. OAS728]MBE1527704.1 hypothetical protein [Sphingopyxis sp. OAS728]
MLTMMIALALATSSTPTTVAATDRRPPLDRPASTMTGTEIKAYNVGLAPTHPDFIKCRKIEEVGSLVKKARVCHTNEQWKQLWVQGNQDSRDTMDAYSSKAGDCRATGTC